MYSHSPQTVKETEAYRSYIPNARSWGWQNLTLTHICLALLQSQQSKGEEKREETEHRACWSWRGGGGVVLLTSLPQTRLEPGPK